MPAKQPQSIVRESSAINKQGFSLIEIVLVSALFVLFSSILIGNLVYGQEATMLSGNRTRAVFLAEEGLEATRNIRDNNFTNLVDGIYGLYNVGGEWSLTGASDVSDIYTRQITVVTIDANTKQITAQVNWQQNPQRTGIVSLVSYLTNWRSSAALPPDTCTSYCNTLGRTLGTCRQNSKQCSKNGEIYEAGGNTYCASPPDTSCCCSPF